MRSEMKVVRRGTEIVLISSTHGRSLLGLLLLEIAALTAYFANLVLTVGLSSELLVPAIPSAALLAWTATLIKPDLRMVLDLTTRQGRLVKVGFLAAPRELARFSLDEVEGVFLRQISDWAQGARSNEYVVDVALRDGVRHALSDRGPLLAYDRTIGEFARLAGIRLKRMPLLSV